ncbi:MAG: cyanophycinase [Chloroflexia bacterium]
MVPAASSFFKEAGERYTALFTDLGARAVEVLPVHTREHANDESHIPAVERATGIFFGGGNQLKLATVFGGTKVLRALKRCFEQGTSVGGTSAGASAMGSYMIAFGSTGSTPKKRQVYISPGLGLIEDVCIDQHFKQRDRVGRLLSAVAQNPMLLGMGLDEDTAVIINPDDTLEVVGSGGVMLLDGSTITHTDAFEVKGHKPIAITDVHLHVLTHGYGFDLAARKPIL